MTPKVSVSVYDHKTLGKDKEVAEGEVEVIFLFLYDVFPFAYTSTLDLATYQVGRRFVG